MQTHEKCLSKICIKNSAKIVKVFQRLFYVMFNLNFDIYLKCLWLCKQNPQFNWIMHSWHYHIITESFLKNFILKNLQNDEKDKSCFIVMCTQIVCSMMSVNITILLNELKEFEDVFILKQKDLLSQHSIHDHNIELKEKKSSAFEFFYNLLKNKLHVLKDYIE